MRKIIIILIAAAFSLSLKAQECPNYYPLSQGSNWELTQYDKKDKVESISTVLVNSYIDTENGYLANIASTTTDAKGKSVGTSEVVMKCENGIFIFDMRNFISAATVESYKDMEVEIIASDMQYPGMLESGSSLPDASITYKITNSGFAMMTITINITNRKIEGKETVITPAGTFDAYKITYNVNSKMGMMKTSAMATEYLSPGNGIVKSETYNEKGVLQGYSLLTKIEKK